MRRKLDVAGVFERIFATYRDQAGLLIPAALAVFVPIALLNGLVYTTDSPFAALAAALIGAIGTVWFQGMVVEATRDILDGRRDYTLGSLFASVSPVLLPLLVVGILAGIGIGIGLVLLIVPGLILLTWWALVAPVVVVERPGILPSFGRSRALVRGNGWQVFGVIVVLFLLQLILSGIIQAIAIAVSDSFGAFAIADLVVRVLVAPLAALAAATMYFELLDLRREPSAAAAPEPAAPA